MGHNTVVSQQPLSRVSGSKSYAANGSDSRSPRVTIARGREAIAALQPQLVALSRATGQAGAMDWLDCLLRSPSSLRKEPHLALITRDHPQSSAGPLVGAALLYEYRFAGLPTGIFTTDDVNGIRTVIAPATSRFEVARLAARQLMRSNAAVVFVSLDPGENAKEALSFPVSPEAQTAQRTRWTPTRLSLASTFDETLAQLGARTRRNLRYYRRRAMAELGAHFVASVQLSLEEFLALNRASTHPLPEDEAEWRYKLLEKSSAQPNTLYAGMRAANGEWLSLVWGQRHHEVTQLHWQMNRTAESHHSFCIAMRAFLMEHEIAIGASELHLIGGTQQPIRACCAETPVTDLLAVRNGSLRGWLLRRFAQRLLPPANFLRGALEDDEMKWVQSPGESIEVDRAA